VPHMLPHTTPAECLCYDTSARVLTPTECHSCDMSARVPWCGECFVPMHRPPNFSPPASKVRTRKPNVSTSKTSKVRTDTYKERKSKRLENLL
jgi:hypothetical protein